jgi:hypothetical protein
MVYFEHFSAITLSSKSMIPPPPSSYQVGKIQPSNILTQQRLEGGFM